MTNYWRLNESGGSTYLDFPGSACGICSGSDCPTALFDVTNLAQDFNGISQRIIDKEDGISPRESVTIMAWVNPRSNTKGIRGFFSKKTLYIWS